MTSLPPEIELHRQDLLSFEIHARRRWLYYTLACGALGAFDLYWWRAFDSTFCGLLLIVNIVQCLFGLRWMVRCNRRVLFLEALRPRDAGEPPPPIR